MWGRRLFTVCSAASLLLWVVACVLWVRSYWTEDRMTVRRNPERLLYTSRGSAILRADHSWPDLHDLGARTKWGDEYDLRLGGFGTQAKKVRVWDLLRGTSGGGYFKWWFAPLWCPALLFAIAPTAWTLARFRARRKSRAGHCPSCGYDLRASPQRCPECGASVG